MKYVCEGCTKRKAGCKKDCLEYTVERVMRQPEQERIKKQKELATELSGAHRQVVSEVEEVKEHDVIILDKYDQIEQIVNRELIAGERNYKSCYKAFFEIVDVIQK